MQLSGLGRLLKMTHLLNSPFTLHKHIINKIKQEAGNAAEGKLSGIDAKMNALTDPKVIRALYAASRRLSTPPAAVGNSQRPQSV